jgi:hypothetical protein
MSAKKVKPDEKIFRFEVTCEIFVRGKDRKEAKLKLLHTDKKEVFQKLSYVSSRSVPDNDEGVEIL